MKPRRRPPRLGAPLLTVDDLKVSFPGQGRACSARRAALRAVDGISFTLHQGETLGVVGESGCGKSTLARAVLQLLPKTGGRVVWLGRDLDAATQSDIRKLREDFQIVFQDPLASLDPRMPIGVSIAEPLKALEPQLSREAGARAKCAPSCSGSAWIPPGSTAIRTNCPAARTSASAWPAP